MNVPVLGSLFRSRDYLRQETELLDHRHALHRPCDRSERGGAAGRELQRGERSAGVAARPRQPHLFELRRPATHARLFRPGGFHHRLTRTRSPCRPSPRKASRCRRCFLVALPSARSVARRSFVAATTSLAGCGVNYASNDSVPPGDYHDALSDRRRARRRPPSTSIRPAARSTSSRSTTSAPSPNAIASLATGGSPFSLRPASAAATRGRSTRSAARWPAPACAATSRSAPIPNADPNRASPVRLVFQGLKATVQGQCGVWPTDLASGGIDRRLEERFLPQFRLRHPIDARRPGRRSARSGAEPRQRPRRRHDAAQGDRRRAQRQGSRNRLDDQAYADRPGRRGS